MWSKKTNGEELTKKESAKQLKITVFWQNFFKFSGKEPELRSRIETNVHFIHHYCLNKVSSPVGSGDDEQW